MVSVLVQATEISIADTIAEARMKTFLLLLLMGLIIPIPPDRTSAVCTSHPLSRTGISSDADQKISGGDGLDVASDT